MSYRFWCVWALAALILCPSGAIAANRPENVEELARGAQRIVLGSVVSKHSYWTADSLIYTDVVVASDVTLKGDDQATVVVQVPGGVVGDTEMTVSDAPEVQDRERVLLFLVPSLKDKDRFEVAGRADGKHTAGSPRSEAALEQVFQTLEKAGGARMEYKRGLAQQFLARSRDALTTSTTTTTATSSCYVSTGVRWPTGSATFRLAASVPVAWAPSVNAAAATWTHSGAAFSLTNNSSSTNELSFIDLVAKYGSSYANTYAVATTWTNTTTNRITKATIEIGTKWAWSTSGQANMADVQNILTHEFGHWLRLSDLYDPTTCSEVTMWGTSPLGETKKRTLEQPDLNGIFSLYGKSGSISAPVLTSPANGATGVATTSSLFWNAASGATAYDVYFGTSASPALVATITGTSYKPASMAAGIRYYWKIVAKNSTASATSETRSFTTAAGALTSPVLLSPAYAATGVSVTPTISWRAVTGVTSYDIYLGTTNTPAKIGSVTGTSVTISGLQRATAYYWKIVARNATASSTSATWWFRTY